MSELKLYLIIGFTVFLIIMAWLGYIATKKTKSISDFAIGGASLGPYVLGLSFTATALSAATFLGYPGWSYEWGYSNMWLYLSLLAAGPLGVLVVAKRARKINTKQISLSLPDWLGDFYNSDFLRIGSGIIMLFNIFYIAAQLAAGAMIFEYMLDLTYTTGLLIITVIVVIYVFAGGAFADIYTDAAQAITMAVAGLVVFVSGIFVFGDGNIMKAFTNITSKLSSIDTNLVSTFNPDSKYFYSISAVLGIFIIQFAFASSPQLFNKVLALKEEKDLGKMILTYFFTTFLSLIILFGGLYSRAGITEAVESSDLALIEYIINVFPVFVTALIGVVILAAAMSTTDGIFVVMSTIFANDIFYKVLYKKGFVKLNEEKANRIALMTSRVVVILVGVIAFLIVRNPPQYMGDVMWIGISGVAAGTLGPILYAVYGKRKSSPRAAELSMIIGLFSYLIMYFANIIPSTMAAGGYASVIGVLVMWIGAYLIKAPENKEFDKVTKVE